jgi:hypothetical protein
VRLSSIQARLDKLAANAPSLVAEQRQVSIDNIYGSGKGFLARVEKYAENERGEKLKLQPWFSQYLEFIGDFRIGHVITTGCAQYGKAQPLNARIVTPSGFKLMGNIQKNDKVIASDGTHATVLDIFPQGTKEIYRVWFCDGTYADCCDDHLWLTQTISDRRVKVKNLALQPHGTRQRDWEPLPDGSKPGSVKTLKEIRETLYLANKGGEKFKANHSVPLCQPVEYEKGEDLIIPPYTMGILLGDGSFRHPDSLYISTADQAVVDSLKTEIPPQSNLRIHKKSGDNCDWKIATTLKGYHCRVDPHPYREEIKKLGLLGLYSHEKFVPLKYMQASPSDRLALLQGLLDSDGNCFSSQTGNSFVEFCCTSKALTDAVVQLARSLGGYAKQSRPRTTFYYGKNKEKIEGKTAYRSGLRLPPSMKPFRLERKLENWKAPELRRLRKYIERVEKLDDAPAQCILIDHPEHLYLTEDFTVTHNTLGNLLLYIDCVLTHRLNSLWAYDQERTLTKCVPLQFYPTIRAWIKNANTKGLSGSKSYYLYQVVGASAIFTYASTNKTVSTQSTGARSGLAAAGARSVSVNADVLFMEERSQYPPGSADPLRYRLSASRLPMPIIRELGTPGGGQGIEVELKDCDRHFYPHALCIECGHLQALNPFGCLLKPKEVSQSEDLVYLSKSGRPLDWFHKDANDPVESAFFGCSNCGSELHHHAVENAEMYCLQSGLSIRDYLDTLPEGIPNRVIKAAFHISPIPRQTRFNNAAKLIKDGLEVLNTNDWCQQGLGWASTTKSEGVTRELVERAILAPAPNRKPDLIVAGIDQGRQQDWLAIIKIWFPDNWRSLKPIQVAEESIRQVQIMQDILRDDIPHYLAEHNVNLCLMDNEPSRKEAIKLAEQVECLEIVDQCNNLPELVRHQIVADGGIYAPCWLIESKTFMTEILNSFSTLHTDGYPLYRLPDWHHHLANPTELSPVAHLISPYRNLLGIWERGKVNDLFVALHFCEAAFYIWINGLRESSQKVTQVFNVSWASHVIGGTDSIDYAYNPKLPIGISLSGRGDEICAIAAQSYGNTQVVIKAFQDSSEQKITEQIGKLLVSHSGEIRIYGNPECDWADIWRGLAKAKVSAYKCYGDRVLPDRELAKLLNQKLSRFQILLLSPSCDNLFTILQRATWKGDSVNGDRAWIECLSYT